MSNPLKPRPAYTPEYFKDKVERAMEAMKQIRAMAPQMAEILREHINGYIHDWSQHATPMHSGDLGWSLGAVGNPLTGDETGWIATDGAIVMEFLDINNKAHYKRLSDLEFCERYAAMKVIDKLESDTVAKLQRLGN